MGNRICNIQYIDNILQYMQYSNILLPEANIAIHMVCQRRILRHCNILYSEATIYCRKEIAYFDIYIYNYTYCARFEAISIYKIVVTNTLIRPFDYICICIFKCISYILNDIYRPVYTKINRIF